MKLVLLVIFLVAGAATRAEQAPCATLKNRDTQTLREFLQKQESSRQSPCLPFAIRELGRLQDGKAISLLISYLDYLDPKTAPSPDGGATERPNYPAVGALFQIGKSATIELISTIQSNAASPETSKNAVRAFADIYRDDLASGVRALKTAEMLAKTDDERIRLNEARKKLVDQCNASDEKQAQACRYADSG